MTLTLDQLILHTVVHHSSTSAFMPNFIEIKKTLLWTDRHMYIGMDGHLRPALLGRLSKSRPEKHDSQYYHKTGYLCVCVHAAPVRLNVQIVYRSRSTCTETAALLLTHTLTLF